MRTNTIETQTRTKNQNKHTASRTNTKVLSFSLGERRRGKERWGDRRGEEREFDEGRMEEV